jgi:hypothetical protein
VTSSCLNWIVATPNAAMANRFPSFFPIIMPHQTVSLLIVITFFGFVGWSVIRGRLWEKRQLDAANRSKQIIEAASQDREKFNEAMTISREQLQTTKDLLTEIKALRDDLKAR